MVFVLLIHRADHAVHVRDSGKVNVVKDVGPVGRGEIHIYKHLTVSRLCVFGLNFHHNNNYTIFYNDKEITITIARSKKMSNMNKLLQIIK